MPAQLEEVLVASLGVGESNAIYDLRVCLAIAQLEQEQVQEASLGVGNSAIYDLRVRMMASSKRTS